MIWYWETVIFLIISVSAGIFGLSREAMVIFIPYAIVDPIIFLSARIWYWRSRALKEAVKPMWLRTAERLGALGIFINIPGSLWLHKKGIGYDVPLHIIEGFIVFYLFAVLYTGWRLAYGRTVSERIISKHSLFITLALNFLWEGWQKLSDVIFGTQLFYDIAQPVITDVISDLSFTALGIFAAYIGSRFHFQPLAFSREA